MKKELIDYIGCLLFSKQHTLDATHKLALQSEKQFTVSKEGILEQEQSLVTSIVVDSNTISMCYVLPDGRMVSFVNDIADVSYVMGNDYTINRIRYKVIPSPQTPATVQSPELLFTLECDEDKLFFVEECGNRRILFSITESH
ncbi:MAG: hypothetical protein QM731_14050 [Chitinophagaceae bacterium]